MMDSSVIRILVVDDDAMTAEYLMRVLVSEGFDVQTEGSVAGAQRVLRDSPPHILLTDLNLPDGSGAELLRSARQSGIASVVLSGCSDLDNGSTHELADRNLAKPIDLEVLLVTIKELCNLSSAAR